jgi:biopolymer transport protein ExbD
MIPDEELSKPLHFNFAPMVDFLFLIVAVFAIALAMKTSLFDSNISLVKTKTKLDYSSSDKIIVNVSVSPNGQYQWITDYNQQPLESAEALSHELSKQKETGILPKDNDQITVLVHIDKIAPWEPIAKLLIEMKKEGYPVHPVYEADTP